MARTIAIISGKGGVGKTTSAINIGVALNKLAKEVVIIDTNLNTPNIGIHLGAPIVPVTLNHVLSGDADIEEAVYEHHSGTKIIPSSLSVQDLIKFNTKKLKNITNALKDDTDFIILDSAAGFGQEAIDTLKTADEIIIITNPEMPSVTDALKAIRVAKKYNKDINGIIITRHKGEKYEMSLDSIQSMLESPVIAVIPEDISVKEALSKRDAVLHTHPKSKVAKEYENIAYKILGEEPPKRGFLSWLFG
jgi:septum site-determining protein MinD